MNIAKLHFRIRSFILKQLISVQIGGKNLKTYFAGIDVGASTTKSVIISNTKKRFKV